MGNRAAGRRLPHLRTRRTQHQQHLRRARPAERVRPDPAPRGTRPTGHPAVLPRPRHRPARVDSGAQHPQDPTQRSVHLDARHQRQSRRFPLFRVQRLPCDLRQRSRPAPFGDLREVRQHGHEPAGRSDHPEGRARTSAQARVHAPDSDQPMHDLPHASAEHVHQHDARLHDVGLRVGCAVHVAGKAAISGR